MRSLKGTVSRTTQLDNVNVLASGTSVRKYQLGYAASPTTNRPQLQTVQEYGGSAGTDCTVGAGVPGV